MLGDDWPGHREESCAAALAAELCLGSDMEESKVACDQVVCYACSLVEDINLAIEDVFGLLVCVLGDVACGAGLDAVEARGEVCWVVLGLCLDAMGKSVKIKLYSIVSASWDTVVSGSEVNLRVEICDNRALACRNGDVFVTGTLDDCERNGFERH